MGCCQIEVVKLIDWVEIMVRTCIFLEKKGIGSCFCIHSRELRNIHNVNGINEYYHTDSSTEILKAINSMIRIWNTQKMFTAIVEVVGYVWTQIAQASSGQKEQKANQL